MPIRIKTDLEWGQVFYLKNDELQLEHSLVGIVVEPPNQIKFRLSYCGDVVEVYDFEATQEPDAMKLLNKKDDGED